MQHPLGTLKARMGASHFLMKMLPRGCHRDGVTRPRPQSHARHEHHGTWTVDWGDPSDKVKTIAAVATTPDTTARHDLSEKSKSLQPVERLGRSASSLSSSQRFLEPEASAPKVPFLHPQRSGVLVWAMTGMGHEDAFPPSRLSVRYRFSQATFAGTRGNGRDAPKAALPVNPRPGHSGRISSLANRRTPLRALVGSSDAIDLRV
jgi:hypothetical protein